MKPLSFRPEWGSIEITRAMIELTSQALTIGEMRASSLSSDEETTHTDSRYFCTSKDTDKIPMVDRFIFVSETCLPFISLHKLGKALYSTNQSWINMRNTPNNGYSRQLQWDRVSPAFPTKFIHKSDQWIALTRHHASLIIRDVPRVFRDYNPRPLYYLFEDVKASDEIYFCTILALAGVDLENVKGQCITYCDWSGNAKNPALFKTLKEVKMIKERVEEESCFFGRKFILKEGLDVKDWLEMIKEDVEQDQSKDE